MTCEYKLGQTVVNEAQGSRLGCIKGTVSFGWAILALFFGTFGVWAALAPLNGAVVSKAVISVDGNRKSVQHLDGGIVKELRVKEGDYVEAGAVLIVLDDSQTRAEFDVLDRSYVLNRIVEERIRAEARGATIMNFPAEFADRRDDPVVVSVWESQQAQLDSRLVAMEARRSVIREKIGQLNTKIEGNEARRTTTDRQLELVRSELETLRPLAAKGLVPRDKTLRFVREVVGLEGDIAEAITNIATARQAIAEQNRSLAQIDADRLAEVSQELRETQSTLLDVLPRLAGARSKLERIEIRSPCSGRVVGLTAFSLGGVINRGDKILDVVPEEERLVVRAQVGVDDISELAPGMTAKVRLEVHKQKRLPPLTGRVKQISADRLTDQHSGSPYYLVDVVLDEGSLDRSRDLPLYAGMAASVIVTTKERTAWDYLVGPLTSSFDRAFNQL